MRPAIYDQPVTQIGIRIPVALKEAIDRAAREDYRTVNAFMNVLIQQALEARITPSSPASEKQ